MIQKLARGDLGFLPHMSEVVWDVIFFARVRIFLLWKFSQIGIYRRRNEVRGSDEQTVIW